MVEDETNHIGGLDRSEDERKQLAVTSLEHCSNDLQFGQLFPAVKKEIDEKLSAKKMTSAVSDDVS